MRTNTTAGWRPSSKLKKGQGDEDEDATSLLSLSLSLAPSSTSVMIGRQEKAEGKGHDQGVKLLGIDRDRSNKAALGLSTLDLTMSI